MRKAKGSIPFGSTFFGYFFPAKIWSISGNYSLNLNLVEVTWQSETRAVLAFLMLFLPRAPAILSPAIIYAENFILLYVCPDWGNHSQAKNAAGYREAKHDIYAPLAIHNFTIDHRQEWHDHLAHEVN